MYLSFILIYIEAKKMYIYLDVNEYSYYIVIYRHVDSDIPINDNDFVGKEVPIATNYDSDDRGVEADSGAGIGNSLSLTVSIDHTIGTGIDSEKIFKKKGRGLGKNNKTTKPKNKTIRTGKPP
jgi:hypothetical protein